MHEKRAPSTSEAPSATTGDGSVTPSPSIEIEQESNSASKPKEEPSLAQRDEWKRQLLERVDAKKPSLVVKGIYIGMDGDAAAEEITKQGNGRIETYAITPDNWNKYLGDVEKTGFNIGFRSHPDDDVRRYGAIWTDADTGKVTLFFFEDELSDFLFNSADMSASEFAQSFIDSYDVPKLAPSEFSGHSGWKYDSPEGWTLRIMTDKTVDVSTTPKRGFN